MQYRFALLALAGFAAAQSSSSSAAGAASTSGVSSQETQCLSKCAAGDVNCQAQCVNVPFPNASQANANTDCARNCKQGDGSPEQTKQYGECLAACASQHYYTSSGTLGSNAGSSPTAAAGAGSGSMSSGAASPTTSGSMSSGSGVAQSSGSMNSGSNTMTASPSGSSGAAAQSGSSTSSSHAAAAATMVPLGMMGVAMAVLAL